MADQLNLFADPPAPFPAGFRYCAEAISAVEESQLVAEFAEFPFQEFQFHGFEGKRRVVSFGWRYDFTQQRILQADAIPPILLDIYHKVQVSSGFPFKDLQQVLVTEYAAGVQIGWHRDRPSYGQIMGLSLSSSCKFRLRKRAGQRWTRVTVLLEPRSAYLMEGPARWEWEHSIPPVEALRYSITFRNLRKPAA